MTEHHVGELLLNFALFFTLTYLAAGLLDDAIEGTADRIYVGSTTSAVIALSPYPVLVVSLNILK